MSHTLFSFLFNAICVKESHSTGPFRHAIIIISSHLKVYHTRFTIFLNTHTIRESSSIFSLCVYHPQ